LNSLKFFLWALGVLPRWFVSVIFETLFFVVYPFLGRLKRICQQNMRSVYGQDLTEEKYHQMTKACLKSISRGMMDLLYYVRRPGPLLGKTYFSNEVYLKAALEKGRGAVVVSAHLGNIPLLFVALVNLGYKVNVIIRPMRDKNFSQFMFGLCARWGINMIETVPMRSFLKSSLQALHKKELLFILLDEVVEDEFACKVDFFGQQVNRALGPVLFHERSHAPIVPLFIVEDENNRFRICVHKELEDNAIGREPGEKAQVISVVTKIIEKYVTQYPTQWGGWLNKRWIKP